MKSFSKFNEELRSNELDKKTFSVLKMNLSDKLSEYKTYILNNIYYNPNSNTIEYKKFNNIKIDVIMRELTNEFTPELVGELKIENFLKEINNILDRKEMNVKRKIRDSFKRFQNDHL